MLNSEDEKTRIIVQTATDQSKRHFGISRLKDLKNTKNSSKVCRKIWESVNCHCYHGNCGDATFVTSINKITNLFK